MRDARELVDGELQQLPKKYRLPLVLCYLEGQTRDEAAARLGWTVGKLKGYLERGPSPMCWAHRAGLRRVRRMPDRKRWRRPGEAVVDRSFLMDCDQRKRECMGFSGRNLASSQTPLFSMTYEIALSGRIGKTRRF